MRTGLILSLLLLCVWIVRAQEETPPYRLHEPTAEEYVQTIIAIDAQAEQKGWDTFSLYQMLDAILLHRYPALDQLDFTTLLDLYTAMDIGHGTYYDRDVWNTTIIHAWLRENQPDLSQIRQIQFADYTISVTPRDFDGDGVDEYLLDVTKSDSGAVQRDDCGYDAEYVDYLVTRQNGSDYQFIETPLFWHATEGGGPIHLGQGGIVELRFDDINADGLPEWVLLEGGMSYGSPMMGAVNIGQLYILGWRNGGFAELTPPAPDWINVPLDQTLYFEESAGACSSVAPRDVTWEFVNPDDDPALEIEQRQFYLDNWYCESYTIRIFDWSAAEDRYVFAGLNREYTETRNCAQRQAEEAFWAKDYTTAVQQYERALTLAPYEENFDYYQSEEYKATIQQYFNTELEQLDQYGRARLALAYILTGQPAKAETLLRELSAEEIVEEPTVYLLEALRDNLSSPRNACIAAFNVYAMHYPEHVYGAIVDTDTHPADYAPDRIGCDGLSLIQQLMGDTTFTTAETPLAQLRQFGLSARKAMQFDLNGDGADEWLIWLKTPMPPYFFAPAGITYHVSQPSVDPYLKTDGVTLWRLPDEAGTTLLYTIGIWNAYAIDFPPWHGAYDPFDGTGGILERCVDESDSLLKLWLWRMDGNELSNFFSSEVCATSVADLFPGGESSTVLDGGAITYEDEPYHGTVFKIEPLVYTWDETSRTFTLAPTPTPPQPPPTATPEPERTYINLSDAYAEGDYAYVVANSPPSLALDGITAEWEVESRLMNHYVRALALEALRRQDEALSAYAAIYEAVPDTAWAMLAALHLGIDDGDSG